MGRAFTPKPNTGPAAGHDTWRHERVTRGEQAAGRRSSLPGRRLPDSGDTETISPIGLLDKLASVDELSAVHPCTRSVVLNYIIIPPV